MMPRLLTSLALSAVVLLVEPRMAGAQSAGRGMEGGLDVLSGARSGELAFYVGAFEGNQMVAFRFGARDEHAAIPCSAGVMYEYVGQRRSGRSILPMAGVSFSRIFSCATDEEFVLRPPVPYQGALAASGGVRLAIFRLGKIDGSLKLLGYVEHLRGPETGSDLTTGGLTVGMAIHRR